MENVKIQMVNMLEGLLPKDQRCILFMIQAEYEVEA